MNTSETDTANNPGGRTSNRFVHYFTLVLRLIMGLMLFVGGANLLFHIFPDPKAVMPEGATAFVTALAKSGYMLQLIGLTQLIVGAFFLINRFVPLALALFAPFMVNSVAFHLVLERSGLAMSLVFLAAELYLAWVYRSAFRPMLAAKVTPA